jgi:hypothetical protein
VAPEGVERKLAAILSADVVGYSLATPTWGQQRGTTRAGAVWTTVSQSRWGRERCRRIYWRGLRRARW